MYGIGPLRPTVPNIEVLEAAIIMIRLALALGQLFATSSFRAVWTPALVVDPHFIKSRAES